MVLSYLHRKASQLGCRCRTQQQPPQTQQQTQNTVSTQRIKADVTSDYMRIARDLDVFRGWASMTDAELKSLRRCLKYKQRLIDGQEVDMQAMYDVIVHLRGELRAERRASDDARRQCLALQCQLNDALTQLDYLRHRRHVDASTTCEEGVGAEDRRRVLRSMESSTLPASTIDSELEAATDGKLSPTRGLRSVSDGVHIVTEGSRTCDLSTSSRRPSVVEKDKDGALSSPELSKPIAPTTATPPPLTCGRPPRPTTQTQSLRHTRPRPARPPSLLLPAPTAISTPQYLGTMVETPVITQGLSVDLVLPGPVAFREEDLGFEGGLGLLEEPDDAMPPDAALNGLQDYMRKYGLKPFGTIDVNAFHLGWGCIVKTSTGGLLAINVMACDGEAMVQAANRTATILHELSSSGVTPMFRGLECQKVMDDGEDMSIVYIAMEVAPTPMRTIAQVIRELHGKRELSQSERYARCVSLTNSAFSAVEQLHGMGVVLHGISPSKLLLDHDGNVKLLDVTLAEMPEYDPATLCGGCETHTAPEVLARQPHSNASDLFSLGVTAYNIFTGRPLLPSSAVREMFNEVCGIAECMARKRRKGFDKDAFVVDSLASAMSAAIEAALSESGLGGEVCDVIRSCVRAEPRERSLQHIAGEIM